MLSVVQVLQSIFSDRFLGTIDKYAIISLSFCCLFVSFLLPILLLLIKFISESSIRLMCNFQKITVVKELCLQNILKMHLRMKGERWPLARLLKITTLDKNYRQYSSDLVEKILTFAYSFLFFLQVSFTRTRYHECIAKRAWQDRVLSRMLGTAGVSSVLCAALYGTMVWRKRELDIIALLKPVMDNIKMWRAQRLIV